MTKQKYLTLAFYKAEHADVVGKLISWWTKWDLYTWKKTAGRFCHVELIFSDGMSFSSQEKADSDGSNYGVRFKKIEYSHPERWMFLRFPIKNESKIRKEASLLIGNKYDWLGILLYQFLPFGKENPKAWYCSECTSYVLGFDPYKLNPNTMFDAAVEKAVGLGNFAFPEKPF